jgi:hypothetical protein
MSLTTKRLYAFQPRHRLLVLVADLTGDEVKGTSYDVLAVEIVHVGRRVEREPIIVADGSILSLTEAIRDVFTYLVRYEVVVCHGPRAMDELEHGPTLQAMVETVREQVERERVGDDPEHN